MKKLICVFALSSILGSIEYSSAETANSLSLQEKKQLFAQLEQNSARKVGSIEVTTNNDVELDILRTIEFRTAQFHNESSQMTKIVLKIDGDDIYTYNTYEYQGAISPIIEISSDHKLGDAELEAMNMSVSGEDLKYSLKLKEEGAFGVEMDINMEGVRKISGPCNETKTIEIAAFDFISDNHLISVPSHTSHSRKICKKPLPKSQLEKLDLKKIMFCDYRGEDPKCVEKDMSFLVSEM